MKGTAETRSGPDPLSSHCSLKALRKEALKKTLHVFQLQIFLFFVIKNLDLNLDTPKSLDSDPDSIRNTLSFIKWEKFNISIAQKIDSVWSPVGLELEVIVEIDDAVSGFGDDMTRNIVGLNTSDFSTGTRPIPKRWIFRILSAIWSTVQDIVLVSPPTDADLDSQYGSVTLKGLSHEIDFKNFDKNLQNLT